MKPSTIKVILDTNILMLMAKGVIAPTHFRESVQARLEFVTCEQVIAELGYLAKNAKSLITRKNARSSLQLIDTLHVRIVKCPGEKADDALIMYAAMLKRSEHRVIVASNDKTLRRRARLLGIPTLYYRESERILELDWEPL
jgi:rRNA-processing protein FCF1